MPIHPDLQSLLASIPAIDFETLPLDMARTAPDFPDAAQPELASIEDITVGTPGGERLVRIHRPLNDGAKPTVVFIHGGGWFNGDPISVTPVTARLAAYLDAVVVSISYRLAPENPFPAAYDDALFLTQWAAARIGELGGLTDAFVIAGESAGANLAAAVAHALKDERVITGQLLLNPATDLSADAKNAASYVANEDPALTTKNMNFFIRTYLGSDSSTDWRASPASAPDFTGLAPAVVGVSGYDPLCDDGRAYAKKLHDAGVPTRLVEFEDLIHAYAAQSFLIPAAHTALVQTLDEFRELMDWPELKVAETS